MKTLKKPLSLLMALFMCLGMFAGTGVTAFAAGETMTTYMVDIPRANDPNKAGWGHPALNFLGGWSTSAGTHFSVHTQDAYNGRAIYCIEPGIGVHSGDQYTGRGEDFWDNYPSSLNPTIPPNTIKEYIGRIMTYGWQGNASTSWMSSNPDHANQMAGYIATQLLVWETIVGERDSQFNHVDANAQGKNNVTEYISAEHPLRSQIFSQYSAIESAVKRHTMLPSFFSSTADAGAYELKWDGEKYSATLTDTNGVLGDYTFSSSTAGLNFSVDGSQLTITSSQALKGSVTVKAEKISAQRSGVVVWTDGVTGGGTQDFATYGTTVSDQMVGYLNLEVKTGNMKLIKTSEDGKVEGISFTITGEGYNATKTTNAAGEIDITDLNPGVYTVTEQSIDKYEPQATQRVTIVSGQTATVTFNNVLKRGSLEVTKTSEDGLAEGMTFHLSGTSLSGLPVDEYAVTDSTGVARFENVLIGTGYVLEEVDTPIRYVVPEAQTATIEWNEVTDKTVNNILKKFRVTVTKSDVETGTPQGDGSLAGATYGLYKGDTLIDSFTTDENGQFTTGYYVCDSDWTIREINPSEGYLVDSTIHHVGAEPELYTIELNDTANDVTEQIIKGDIAIIKHTDDGETGIETPEEGAEFQIYLKAAGSYDAAKDSERDVLVCDENGFTERIAGYEKDVALAAAHPKGQEGFCGMVIEGKQYAEKEDAGKAIIDVCSKMTGSDAVLLGEYRGFSMVLAYDGISNEYRITLKGTLSHTVTLGADVFGNIARLDNALENLAGSLQAEQSSLEETKGQLENARAELGAPFAREEELAEKTARLNELNVLLKVDEKDKTLIDSVPDEGEEVPERKVVGLER